MKGREEKYVEISRASVLLGIPEHDLWQISQEMGLGHQESRGSQQQTYFTYEELRKICMLCVNRVH